MSVSEMLSKVTSAELTEWIAYFKVKKVRDKQERDKNQGLNRLKNKRRR